MHRRGTIDISCLEMLTVERCIATAKLIYDTNNAGSLKGWQACRQAGRSKENAIDVFFKRRRSVEYDADVLLDLAV